MICRISMPAPRQPLIMFWLEAWWNHVRWQMYVWAFASQVLNPDLRGVLGLLVMAKLRDCLVLGGGTVWGEIDLKWCCFDCHVVSLEGVVLGHSYNEGQVFYLVDMLMRITLGTITIRGTRGAVVNDHTFLFGTQHLWLHWQFLEN